MRELVRDGVRLTYEEAGEGDPPLVLVHGMACNAAFWQPQFEHLSANHRVLALDLRGHGQSDAPVQRYTMRALADDVSWICSALEIQRPVLVGHSLGGLVALELTVSDPGLATAAVLIDSVLLAPGDRVRALQALVDALGGQDPERALRAYFAGFFGPYDDPERMRWILDEAARTPAHVPRSIWEEWLHGWDDADALTRCEVPLLYLDAGTPNSDLARAAELAPGLIVGRTVGSGHFSPLEVPEQINAMLDRFLVTLGG